MFNCNCKWTETIIAAVILIVTIWPGIFAANVNKWIVIVAAASLLLHAWKCGNMCAMEEMPKKRRR